MPVESAPAGPVEAMYDRDPKREWSRMDRHPMEFATTWRAMREYIGPNSTIADIGGGPGRYSIALARCGHSVTLLELSQANLDLATVMAAEGGVTLRAAIKGNALNLEPLAADAYDVALLMGPLYHLLLADERDQAIREAIRVTRPGGLVFATFLTRYAFLLDTLMRNPEAIVGFDRRHELLLGTGVHIGSEFDGFTDAWLAHPTDVSPLMAKHGLIPLRLAGAEGFLGVAEASAGSLPDPAFERWVDLCYRLGTDPTTWGSSFHMLYVGRKPQGGHTTPPCDAMDADEEGSVRSPVS